MNDSTTTTAGVVLAGVTKRYGRTVAVDDVTLSIGPGITGLLGPNGAGKTTLLRVIATVLAPDSGEVELLGHTTANAQSRELIRRQLGYVPQEPGFHRQFSAFDFVDYVAVLKLITDRRARHDEVRRVLDVVGLTSVMHKRIRQLSGGMRRRVASAQALLGSPTLLVLDEPTAGLDPEQRLRFRELLSNAANGATVVLSTHQTDDVAALCQRVVVMHSGVIRYDGTPAGLASLAAGRVWLADVRDPAAQLAWMTGDGMVRHVGEPPTNARLDEPRVEDGYLLLVGGIAAAGVVMEMIVVGAVVFGIAYAFTHRGSNRITTDEWQPGQLAPAHTSGATVRPVSAGTQRAAGVQLARVEGRQLLRNEVFIVAVFMSIAILVVFGLVWASDNLGAQNSWRYWLALLPVFTLPFAGMTLVAMNLAALRARRDGAEELFGSLPATATTRVGGHLGSVWMALVIQVLFVAATFASGTYLTDHFGAIDWASIGDIAVGFVLVVCAGSLALALARWLPSPLVALATLVVLAIVGSAIGAIGGKHWSLTRQLSIWPRYPDHDWAFAVRPSWWHAAYLLSLALVVAVVAVARQRRDRWTLLLGVGAVSLAGVTGYLQTRPMTDGDAARIAAMTSDPVAHSTCSTTDGLTFCAYRDYADITQVWTRELTPPFAAVAPPRRADGFTVTWQEPRIDRLDPAVRDLIDVAAIAESRRGDRNTWNGVAVVGTESNAINRLALGLWSVELPTVPAGDAPCWTGGRARGVLALWVAAQGMSQDDAEYFVGGTWNGFRDSESDLPVPAEWVDGYVWISDATPPVLWSATDIVAAQEMLTLDATLVRDTLWADWSRWSGPAATTEDLIAELGLTPAGTPSVIPAGLVACA